MSPEEPKPDHVKPLTRVGLLFRNPLSLAGAALALVALANILFLLQIDVLSEKPSPYIGILAYMVGPAFLIVGLLLIPAGLWWDHRNG